MKTQTKFVQGSKTLYQPNPGEANRSAFDGAYTPGFFFSTDVIADPWLQALGVNCQTYVNNYRADRSQSAFAIGLARSSAINRLRGTWQAFKGNVADLPTPSFIADAIYGHCVTALGQAPGATYNTVGSSSALLKPSGLAMGTVAGIDIGSALLGTALGAVASYLYCQRMPKRSRR